MRSLRDLLINKREEKKLTISQVSYETNISKKYIEALENEEFSVFPAEAYLLGFLRNYTDFLDLDYDTALNEYKNCLLREEPTPLSELMGVKKAFEIKPWMVILPVILIVLFLGIPPIIKAANNQIEKRKEALRLTEEQKSKVYNITNDFIENKVRVGDSFVLSIGSDQVIYVVREVSSNLILTETFNNNEKVITLKLGSEEESEFIDKGKKYIITLFLKDIGGFSDNSAIMKTKAEIKEIVAFENPNNELNSGDDILSDSKVIMVRKRTPDPYSLSIKFEGDILFRYQQKGDGLVEQLYQKNSLFNMDVTKSIQIWTSNAGLTKLKINGEVLVLGRTGQVHVFTLRWIYYTDKDEYSLEYSTAY